MKDRERWMDGEATDLERMLLSAVANERPGRKLQRRMRAGIGLAGSFATLKAAAAALSVAAVVTGVAVAVVDRDASEDGARTTVSAPLATTVVVPAKNSEEASSGAETPPAAVVDEKKRDGSAEPAPAAPGSGQGDATESRTAGKRTSASQAVNAPSALKEQMRILDRARSALRAGDPKRALSELATYSQRYPRGAFGQEATVLRVEALKQSGQDARASALAREFVSRHADSPHVERVSKIAGSGK